MRSVSEKVEASTVFNFSFIDFILFPHCARHKEGFEAVVMIHALIKIAPA